MSKSDLRARPIYHHRRDSIEAHPTIAMAALTVSRWLERRTGSAVPRSCRPCGPTAASRVDRQPHPASRHALDDQARTMITAVDAAATAHKFEPSQALRHPCSGGGVRAALGVLVAAGNHMSSERTGTINALTGPIRSTDLGLDARRQLAAGQVVQITGWRTRCEALGLATARAEALRLARRAIALDGQLSSTRPQMSELVADSPAAGLLDRTGMGAVTASRSPRGLVPSGPGLVGDLVRLSGWGDPIPSLSPGTPPAAASIAAETAG